MQPENDRVYLKFTRCKAYEFKKMQHRRVNRQKSKETARFLGNAAEQVAQIFSVHGMDGFVRVGQKFPSKEHLNLAVCELSEASGFAFSKCAGESLSLCVTRLQRSLKACMLNAGDSHLDGGGNMARNRNEANRYCVGCNRRSVDGKPCSFYSDGCQELRSPHLRLHAQANRQEGEHCLQSRAPGRPRSSLDARQCDSQQDCTRRYC